MINFINKMIIINILLSFIVEGEILTINKLWTFNNNNYIRPIWAKNITIEYENNKILNVGGIIIPIVTKNFRPNNTPNPYNNCSVGIHTRNDRGHIFALSNGGVNIKENIIPQPDLWQRSGNWRKFEKYINRLTINEYNWENSIMLDDLLYIDEPLNKVYWKINLIYKDKCSDKENDCNCQPIKYNGFIKINNKKKYIFEIINNGTYFLKKYNDDNHDITYISFIIPCIIILFISILIRIYIYCKNKIIRQNIREYNNLDNNLDVR